MSAAATPIRRSPITAGSPTSSSASSKAAEAGSTAQSCASAAVRPGFARRARYRDGAPLSDESRSEEHTSELQSLMRISNAVFCLIKKNIANKIEDKHQYHTE